MRSGILRLSSLSFLFSTHRQIPTKGNETNKQDKGNPVRNYISDETAAVLGLSKKKKSANNNDSNKSQQQQTDSGDSKVVEINIEEAKPKTKASKIKLVAQNIVLNMNAFAFMCQVSLMPLFLHFSRLSSHPL